MGSLMAKNVALEVIELQRQGIKPVISKIAVKHGYSLTSARNNTPQNTKTYKDIMARDSEITLKNLSKLRQIALKRAKELGSEAKYSEAVTTIDTTTKNIQLLSGGRVGNEAPFPILNVENLTAKSINLVKIEKGKGGQAEP